MLSKPLLDYKKQKMPVKVKKTTKSKTTKTKTKTTQMKSP